MAAMKSLLQFYSPNPPFKVLYYSQNHIVYNRTKQSVSCKSISQYNTVLNSSSNTILESGSGTNEALFDASWVNKMIKDYTDDGLFEDAIRIYVQMFNLGFAVEKFQFFPCLIKAFGGLCDVEKGRQIHGHVLKLGVLDDDLYILNSVLGMYWKCGAVEDAVKLFEKMNGKDAVSWNTMISGLEHLMDYEGSLTVFRRMIFEGGVLPTRVACVSALSSCASLGALIHGKEIHAFAIKCSLNTDEVFLSGLIGMYMKFGKVACAELIFQTVISMDTSRANKVLWNVMISEYVFNDCLSEALALFIDMLVSGLRPDSSTAVSVLVGCSKWLELELGKQIHCLILTLGLVNDVRVETALLDMYFKCGYDSGGLNIFRQSQNRNLVMWGAVISNCAQSGSSSSSRALELFSGFCLEYGVPDPVILLAVLRACSSLTSKRKGMESHALAIKLGYDSSAYIGGALVDMYAKCRDITSSEKAFVMLIQRDRVTWNALISGYVQNEYADEALKAFRRMQSENIRPNSVTISSLLSVCAQLSTKVQCKEIHSFLIRQGFEFNLLVSNSLISTYAKCGDMSSSSTVFQRMSEKDEVSWNSIILGFGMHGDVDKMFILFDKMINVGLKPDHTTFTAILSACSHAGRVNEGWKYFNSMVYEYKLKPLLEQYTCMVDLLGRAGHLYQAYDLIRAMPFAPDDRIWGSLLASCKSYSDEKLAKVVADHIFKLDPSSVGYRVLLANLHKELGDSDEVNRVRSEIKDRSLKKNPGCSWIEVKNSVHIFVAGDKTHCQTEDIYATLESLTRQMKKENLLENGLSPSFMAMPGKAQ